MESLPQLLRLPAVLQATGLARSTVYRMVAEHTFPAPVRLAKRAVGEGWSVRAVEEAIRDRQAGGAGEPAGADGTGTTLTPGTHDGAGLTPVTRLRPPGLLELEHLLAEHLSTKVAVTMGAKRGKVSIDFADLEDLERIYRRMVEDPDDSIA